MPIVCRAIFNWFTITKLQETARYLFERKLETIYLFFLQFESVMIVLRVQLLHDNSG